MFLLTKVLRRIVVIRFSMRTAPLSPGLRFL